MSLRCFHFSWREREGNSILSVFENISFLSEFNRSRGRLHLSGNKLIFFTRPVYYNLKYIHHAACLLFVWRIYASEKQELYCNNYRNKKKIYADEIYRVT